MKAFKYLLPFISVVFIAISGCKDDNEPTGDATVNFYLTDAPANYDAIHLEVLGIEVHTSSQGWVTLNSALGVIDLLSLTNGTDTLIAGGNFSGNISQVRVILGDDNTIVVDGVTHDLTIPSGQESGLKLNVHQDLEAGKIYAWTLDFDASKSIVHTGAGDYKLKPVIRAFAQEVLTVGSIYGSVSPVAITSLCAINSANDTICTMTGFTGGFLIQNLAPGTYTVLVEPALPLNTVVINNVVVTNVATDVGVVALQ